MHGRTPCPDLACMVAQVHEKSILMPMMPLALVVCLEPAAVALILPMSLFSMFPLLERDGLALPYTALLAAATFLLPACLDMSRQPSTSHRGAEVSPAALDDASTPQSHASTADESGCTGPDKLGNRADSTASAEEGEQVEPHVCISLWQTHALGLFRYAQAVGVAGMLGLHVFRILMQPPAQFPFLHDLLATSFAFLHFLGLFVYCTVRQLCLPSEVWIW
jgi:ALG6, ALG8 glycosyltransferase family